MTDNEIIKAFANCQKDDANKCLFCQFDAEYGLKCTDRLLKSVLDLINRQKREIDVLKDAARDEKKLWG